ncbi:site-specific integrase [Rhizobium laguerreae]|uniref:site-specific integrase n=1 Tax=Rhizobium laguerreae TaxID=1076926 RepID=UPI001C91F2D8|nr:site-specific integrase [Rhizobium laguerreae]MBY3347292.1 site-specific integrase [Rhizobium laguerreae]MBY3354440.1 site-specific integrase [Rhizobium laguerreae]MBY3375299.1 site-specific integrase [Rhizobium laguerreae]MBY3430529.1 site-specific integrase [Rhizobium laguerreae]MBY3439177.1 site-specific integrase [Rhizobium laguerreae]
MGQKLTRKLIEKLTAADRAYFEWDGGDGAVKGFGVAVNPSGKKTFIAQFRIGRGQAAKSKRATIGSFGTWTVEQARDRARELIVEGERGIDRTAEEKDRRDAAAAAKIAADRERRQTRDLRFERLAVRFLREHVRIKRKKNTELFYRHVIAAHLLPAFRRRDVRTITKQDVAKLHRSLADKPAMANRAITTFSAIWGWAEGLDILPEGLRKPTFKLEKFKEHAKDRFLSVDELQRLGAAIREAETSGVSWQPDPAGKTKHAPKEGNRFTKIDPGAAAALRLLIFTGARLREVLNLEWSFVDLDRGLLRLKDSKTGPKTILLNSPARAVLAGMEKITPFVFPGESRDGKIQPRTDLKRPWRLVTKAADLEDVRIHDLRHSFASIGAGDGHGLVIIGKLLGHTQSSTTERYAHLDNDPLRRASDAIAERIASAMGEARPEKSAEIISIKGAR